MTSRASPRTRLAVALPAIAAVLTATGVSASESGDARGLAAAGRPRPQASARRFLAVISEMQPAAVVTRPRSFFALTDLTVSILAIVTALALVVCVVLEACLTLWFDIHVARAHLEPSQEEAEPRGPPGRA